MTSVETQNAAVVIPTFNERDNVPKLIDVLLDLYPDIHILVVDDHSPDGTSDVVRAMQASRPTLMLLERMKNHGFAPSYRDGFQLMLAEPWCKALITMDADFSHNPLMVRHLLQKLANSNAVVGSRYTLGGSVEKWSLGRKMLSRSANFYVRQVLGVPLQDTTSGFICMRREAIERVPFQSTVSEGYAFLVELKYLLFRSGSRIAEHPITFEERREGQSKMSAGKIWESFWMPWRIRFGSEAIVGKNG